MVLFVFSIDLAFIRNRFCKICHHLLFTFSSLFFLVAISSSYRISFSLSAFQNCGAYHFCFCKCWRFFLFPLLFLHNAWCFDFYLNKQGRLISIFEFGEWKIAQNDKIKQFFYSFRIHVKSIVSLISWAFPMKILFIVIVSCYLLHNFYIFNNIDIFQYTNCGNNLAFLRDIATLQDYLFHLQF